MKTPSSFLPMLIGAGLIVFFGTLWVVLAAPSWSGGIADLMAGGMVTPDDNEVAVTPYTPTVSLLEVAGLSGRGEGLDCSIPGFVENRAFAGVAPNKRVSLLYRQACVAHDYCYRHGATTYGYVQADCDGALARAALRICKESNLGRGREDCVHRARKVYAGLLAGGASAFRPAQPDAVLSVAAPPKEKQLKCHNDESVRYAFTEWPEKLALHLRGQNACEVQTALTGHYDELKQPALDALMQTWQDLASVAGEYDPYPLATARMGVPRLAPNGEGGQSLYYYLSRPGGAEIHEFRWRPIEPGKAQAACDAVDCGGAHRVISVSATYAALPSAPWVVPSDGSGPGLLWWRRSNTYRNTTFGNTARIKVVPSVKKGDPSRRGLTVLGGWEPNSTNTYPVFAPDGDVRLGAFYFDSCPEGAAHGLVFAQRRLNLNGDDAAEKERKGLSKDDLGGRDILSALSIPPQIVRDDGGVAVTIFRREGVADKYRQNLDAVTWQVSDERPAVQRVALAKTKRCPLVDSLPHGRPTASFVSTYAVSEQLEPFAALPQQQGPPLLLSLRCERPTPPGWWDRVKMWFGLYEEPRCADVIENTEIYLTRAGMRAHEPLIVRGRYISRVPVFRIGASQDYAIALVRFALKRTATRIALYAYSRVVVVTSGAFVKGNEINLGEVSPPDETTAGEALNRSLRLFPIVGDTDGNGKLDLILADPDHGDQALSYPSLLSGNKPAFGLPPKALPKPAG